MPQPRKYANAAERTRAYRERLAATPLQERAAKKPTYPKWRKTLRDAHAILEATYEEIHYWMQERSERWQESDRAGEMEADRDSLQDILASIESLNLWSSSHD